MEEAMKREWDAWLEECKQISSADHIPLELSNKLKSLLLQCVQKGYADVLKEAYEKIPLARRATIDDLRRTALHFAVNYCETVAVEPMLERVDPADLLIQDEFGQTALHIAILKRKPELCIRMLEISPGVGTTRNRNGDTPLILAACNKLEDLCIHMIKRSCVENSHIFVQNLDKDTAFHLAVDNGLENLCSLLIERASADNLLLQNNNGDTVLHVAIQKNMPKLCIRMLEISPRLGNIQNIYANTPLIHATYYGLEDLCIHMIECASADNLLLQNNDGDTVLHVAIQKNIPKLCIRMLDISPRLVNIQNRYADTPLILATYCGLEDVCKYMIERASAGNLLLQNNYGDTVLHVAIKNNMPELCILMLEISPGLGNIQNRDAYTPLILATYHVLEDLCIHMIKRSCVERSFIFVQDSFQDTAFHLAVSKGMRKLCKLLIKDASANDLLVKDGKGNTTFHLALDNGNFEIAHQMLQVNPSLGNEINGDGKTPLDILARRASSVISSRAQLGVIDSLIYPCIPDADLRRAWYNEGDFCKEESKMSHITFKSPLKLWLKIMHKIFWSENRQTRDEENLASTSARQPRDEEISPSTLTMHNALDNDEGLQKQESWLRKMFYKFCALTLVERVKKIRNKKQQYLLICDLFDKLASFEESPLFIVAEVGLTEVVKKIMNKNPKAIHQRRSSDNKNAVLLAAENRRGDVYELLFHHCREKNIHSDIFRHKDSKGNNALHLVAKFNPNRRPWRMPGNTMQMHWEIKWYKYVKDSIPEDLWMATNQSGLTPAEVFKEEHGNLYNSERKGEWVSMTSQAFSVVAGLIATVAFNSATTIPGSNSEKGYPNFRGHPALSTFVIFSFIALFLSLLSLIKFLSILISPLDDLNDVLNYVRSLPMELIKGLTTLFFSIVAMLVSFCAGHYFYLKHPIRSVAIPVYLIGCFIIASFFFKNVYSSFLFYAVRRKPDPWYEISK